MYDSESSDNKAIRECAVGCVPLCGAFGCVPFTEMAPTEWSMEPMCCFIDFEMRPFEIMKVEPDAPLSRETMCTVVCGGTVSPSIFSAIYFSVILFHSTLFTMCFVMISCPPPPSSSSPISCLLFSPLVWIPFSMMIFFDVLMCAIVGFRWCISFPRYGPTECLELQSVVPFWIAFS